MRNVALRMKNKELASCVVVWKQCWRDDVAEQLAHARAERIMQRVAGRWRNQDVAAGFLSWHQSWRCYADEARALGMMRRVGARMRMQEVVEAVSEWRASAASGVLQMVCNRALQVRADHVCCVLQWRQRLDRSEHRANELELKLKMASQVAACSD